MSTLKRRASVYRHGTRYLAVAMAFFPDAPGATPSTISTVLGDRGPVTDADLGEAVLEMVQRSGVLDDSQVGGGEPGRTVMAVALGLPDDAVLESESVVVSVSLHQGQLVVRASQSMGPGGGFFGSGLEPVRLDPGSAPAVVGATVREATEAAIRAGSSVLKPAGSWQGEGPLDAAIPSDGVVTVRREADDWLVTARIGDRWTKTEPSSSVTPLRLDASSGELGRAVVDALARAAAGDLQSGEEDLAGGDRQVLVEADEHGLTIYPQAISGETGVWDVAAHPDVRTLSRQASATDVGQAVSLVADEEPDWAS